MFHQTHSVACLLIVKKDHVDSINLMISTRDFLKVTIKIKFLMERIGYLKICKKKRCIYRVVIDINLHLTGCNLQTNRKLCTINRVSKVTAAHGPIKSLTLLQTVLEK